MDKNKKRNDQPIDMDNFGLKDHLNASFDLDKLVVSEDLINKTLKAIKESETNNGSEMNTESVKDTNRKKAFPVRRLVGAAAAFMVLFVGMYAFQNNLGSKQDAGTENINLAANEDSNITSDAAEQNKMEIYSDTETPSAESYASDSATITEGAKLADNPTDTVAGDESTDSSASLFAAEQTDGTMSTESTKEDADQTGEGDSGIAGTKSGVAADSLLFSSLYPVTYDTPETFTISNTNGNSAVLTDTGSTAGKFYDILDTYALTEVQEVIGDNWTYKIDIKAAENQNYTYLFGDLVQVTAVDKDGNSSVRTYEIDNINALMQQMDDFFADLH